MATSWQIEQPTKQAFTDVVVDSTCDITLGDATVTMDHTSNLKVGMYVRGIYVPWEYGTNTTSTIYQVASITNSTTFELNAIAVKSSQSNITLEFFLLSSFTKFGGKATSNDDFTLNVNTLSANLLSNVTCSIDASSSTGAIIGTLLNDIIEIGDSVKIFSPFAILNNTFKITGQIGSSTSTFPITVEEDAGSHAIVYELNPVSQSWGFDGTIT